MNIKYFLFFSLLLFMIQSCNSDERITRQLLSKDKDDLIEGAIAAGKSKNKKFIPLLLNNAANSEMSTNFSFKGVSVYRAKMNALRQIFQQEPFADITDEPDSLVIKFFIKLNDESK